MAGSDFSIDFAAAAPQIYDHDIGGGAFEDKTINVDAVESLEGGDFAVGDIVSYYFNVNVKPDAVDQFAQTIEIDVSFLVNTTGQTGVSHRDIVGVSANYYTGELDSNGDVTILEDTAIIDDDSTTAWIVPGTKIYENKVSGEVYPDYDTAAAQQGAVVSATVRLNDLEPGEEIVLRVDTLLDALAGSTPTGNLQGFVTGARVVSPTDDPIINVGNQTIPFKLTDEISGIPELAPGLEVEKVVTNDLTGLTVDYTNNTTSAIDADSYFDSIANESVNVIESSSTTPTTPTIRYIYKVTNSGNIRLDNIFLQEDNGTPNDTSDDFTVFFGDNGNDVRFLTADTANNAGNNELQNTSRGNFRLIGAGFINDNDLEENGQDTTLATLEDLDGGSNNQNNVENRDFRSLSPGNSVYVYYDVAVLPDTYSATSITNTATIQGSINPNGGGQKGTPITDSDTANIKVLDNSSASLSGFTYLDFDNDGVKDADEPGIAGASITITINESTQTFSDGSQSLSVQTDLTGAYLFTGLPELTEPEATYTITQTQPSNYFDGQDTVGTLNGATGPGIAATTAGSNQISSVVVANGNYYENYNFGEILPASISGVAYIDSINDNDTPLDTSDDTATADGDRQDTEAGRGGILVTLTGTNDFNQAVNLTTTTDSSGRYYFGDLRPSNGSGYTVSFGDGSDAGLVGSGDIGSITDVLGNTSSIGSAGSNDDITGIILGGGENGSNYDFGLPVSNVGGVISGTVYEDTGIYTSGVLGGTDDGLITDSDSSSTSTTPSTGEKRISGVTIQIYDNNNNLVATTTTDINGNYSFTNLFDGTYEVREVQPQYYDPSANDGDGGFVNYLDGKDAKDNTVITENSDTITNLVISGGNNLIGNNFGELPPASISGYVFLDLLNSKQFGLAPDDSNTTEADGEALINSDTDGFLQGIEVGDQNNTIVDANNITGNSSVAYSVDVRNGEFDDEEFGLAGIEIQLSGTDDQGNPIDSDPNTTGNQPLTTTTDANGYYRFDGLRPSNGDGYTVTQVQPSDYQDGIYNFDADLDFSRTEVLPGNILGTQEGLYGDTGYTANTAEDNFSSINLTFGQSGVDYNFPEATSSGLITGTVYADVDNDDVGDSPLSGVTIELLDDLGTTVIATTTTNTNGYYTFTNVAVGSYQIRQTDLGGYESVKDEDSINDGDDDGDDNTANTNDNLLPVAIVSGEIDSGNDFIDEQKNTITGTGKSEALTNTTADVNDVFIGGAGQDTLTGNGGNDCFKFNRTSDGIDIITDFTSGDKIDLSDFLATGGELAGITNPFGTYVEALPIGTSGTLIQIDFEPTDSLPNKNLVYLQGYDTSTTAMTADDFIL